MASLVEKVSVGVLAVVALAFLIFPAEMNYLLGPGFEVMLDGVRWADGNLPRPAFLALVFLVTAAVTILVALSTARVLYALSRRAGPRTRWLFDTVTPSSPIGKGAFAFAFTILFLIGSVWALPYVIGDLSESDSLDDTDGLVDNGSESVLDEAERDALRILERDAVRTDGGGTYDGPPYERPEPDADGDRLKDDWERAGRTPGGVRLPGADPERMDLYVQINYGGGTLPLSAREKRQLRAVWASMPVENPDGSEGITLHIDDERPGGGPLGRTAVYDGVGSNETTRYYTSRYLGGRTCRYHQVVFGTISGDVGGRASAPGYASYVDTDRNENYVALTENGEFDREVSPVVHVITHELLHNVVGEVDGSAHTEEGWLAPNAHPREAFLSAATASELERDGFAGSGYYQHELCGGPAG